MAGYGFQLGGLVGGLIPEEGFSLYEKDVEAGKSNQEDRDVDRRSEQQSTERSRRLAGKQRP